MLCKALDCTLTVTGNGCTRNVREEERRGRLSTYRHTFLTFDLAVSPPARTTTNGSAVPLPADGSKCFAWTRTLHALRPTRPASCTSRPHTHHVHMHSELFPVPLTDGLIRFTLPAWRGSDGQVLWLVVLRVGVGRWLGNFLGYNGQPQ